MRGGRADRIIVDDPAMVVTVCPPLGDHVREATREALREAITAAVLVVDDRPRLTGGAPGRDVLAGELAQVATLNRAQRRRAARRKA